MSDDSPFPSPTSEHKAFESLAGTWNADCTFYMPGGAPMKMGAKETIELFGPFFTVSHFEGDMFGMPYQGKSSMGYEPKSGEYVATWIDTLTPQLFSFRGKYDDAGKVLTMHAQGTDFNSGATASYRTTEEHLEDGSRKFEMFMTLEGMPEMQLFTHIYTRA
ncbi:MAG: DUF1579 family protein [Planctomycetota bacterium]